MRGVGWVAGGSAKETRLVRIKHRVRNQCREEIWMCKSSYAFLDPHLYGLDKLPSHVNSARREPVTDAPPLNIPLTENASIYKL